MKQPDLGRVYEILSTVIYPTIATVDEDGIPWATPQFMVFDSQTNAFYWCADGQSRHAQNLEHNAKASIVAYDSMAAPGAGEGVYTQVTVEIVTASHEQEDVFNQLLKKHSGAPYWSISDIQAATSPIRLFKASVEAAWINKGRDKNGYFVLYREPIMLSGTVQGE